jgi:4-aminobutyrate aminotransferase-like enzyme
MAIRADKPAIAIDPATGANLVHEYEARTPRSRVLAERAQRVMPGGETRTITFHPPYPLTGDVGAGCQFSDVDGNVYFDLINNYTSLLHGHAHPLINAAVAAQIEKGTTFATALESQIELAEILTERVSSVDMRSASILISRLPDRPTRPTLSSTREGSPATPSKTY